MAAEDGRSASINLRARRKSAASADSRERSNHFRNSEVNDRSLAGKRMRATSPAPPPLMPPRGPSFAGWSLADAAGAARHHPVPCAFALSLLFFMGVEYTIPMIPSASPPLDVGFMLTESFHGVLAANLALNTLLAALNTVFVGMQTLYILWTFLVEGRPRPTIAALFMFTCRGILGCSTQLPLPQEFLGSGVDFPVGNVSFFLFFSGHVAGAVIASLDMRRTRRRRMAWAFDAMNLLQSGRLLASRGHYTIDLAVGVGAGFVFDVLAGRYEESRLNKNAGEYQLGACCTCRCNRRP